MALFEATRYIKHFFTAKSLKGHGVHSPFVFELVTEVFPESTDSNFPEIEQLRKKLLSDKRTILVNDLGAGSKKLSSTKRSISSIVRHSAKSAKTGRLLHRVGNYLKPAHILELGTSLGLTTAYLAKTGTPVTTIEGCDNIANEARSNFDRLKLTNIYQVTGNFDNELPVVLEAYPECNFIFVDGNHTYDATLRYYYTIRDRVAAPLVIIFDDIYWSKGMSRAWKEIVSDSGNQVTIDLFHLGLVFFKPDQEKEHFSIRI